MNDKTLPDNVLVEKWGVSGKPVALDLSVSSPLKSEIISEEGDMARYAAAATVQRTNTAICEELHPIKMHKIVCPVNNV